MNRKIVIVGGGTAGWMTAAYLGKYHGYSNITVVESSEIAKIGVGESVTPHVSSFFEEIGIPTHEWMSKTGAVYKLANKFTGWVNGNEESEYFSFNYTFPEKNFYRDVPVVLSRDDFSDDVVNNRSIDYLAHLCTTEGYNRFDRYFNPQFHYMEKNVAPFNNDKITLNQPLSFSNHINAELASVYIREEIAKPKGVKQIVATVNEVIIDGKNITKLILSNGEEVTADLFIDCSGFHKVLIGKLNWGVKEYKNHYIDRAWVCQTLYEDQSTEMVNYTQSIAEPHGWRFKIGLYHRMGNGYCYSSRHVDDDQAREHFMTRIKNPKADPRLIKWTPSRLEKFGEGNVAAVGLSCGFVEPLEANALYTIVSSIRRLNNVLDSTTLDFTVYNDKMSHTIDDIADFILVHYTLSSRKDTQFWKDMTSIGSQLNHTSLVQYKIDSFRNSMKCAIEGYTMFPDYMWVQLAVSWGIDINERKLDPTILELAKIHFNSSESKHKIITDTMMPNYLWHKETIFNGMSGDIWGKTL